MIEWLLAFDRHVSSKGNKVLLLLNSFSAHEAATKVLAESSSLCDTFICFYLQIQPLEFSLWTKVLSAPLRLIIAPDGYSIWSINLMRAVNLSV